jgi:hypothetical protein
MLTHLGLAELTAKHSGAIDMKLYSISWTQPYTGWVPIELPITDLTQAREVIARIMAK